jgi:hypothetical protein
MADQGCKLFVYGINENMDNGEVKVMYLTCLPYSSFTSCPLQAEFEKFGQVTDTYNTGKGFAFVTFDRKEDAQTATREMDGANFNGQQIKVNEALPKGEGGGGGGGCGGGGGGYGGGGYGASFYFMHADCVYFFSLQAATVATADAVAVPTEAPGRLRRRPGWLRRWRGWLRRWPGRRWPRRLPTTAINMSIYRKIYRKNIAVPIYRCRCGHKLKGYIDAVSLW